MTVNSLVILLSVSADVRDPIYRRFFLLKFTFNISILTFNISILTFNILWHWEPIMSEKIGELILKFGSGTDDHQPDAPIVNIHSYWV